MATEVLRPQDLLAERFSVHPTSFHRRRIFPASSGNLANFVVSRKQQRRTSPPKPDKKRFAAAVTVEANRSSHHRHDSVTDRRADTTSSVGKVTLLRRGESLSSIAGGKPSDRNRNSVNGLPVLKPIRPIAGPPADIYAGSAFSMSPSPRSVPLPSFFNRKDSNDGATRDLRRLLRLE